MNRSRPLGRSKSFHKARFHLGAIALGIVAVIEVWGCGGGSTYSSTPASPPPTTPAAQDASVHGQYNLVLTSTAGQGMTVIYTDFTQTGGTFAGAGNTLVCRSNDPSQCEGSDPSADPIIPSGAISGRNVSMTISFPSPAGADSVTMIGTGTGGNLAGTYADTRGDAGTWTASLRPSLSGTYSGTFNSTSTPLTISPTISITLRQFQFDLTGTATIMSSPCISSLTLSGQAIGGAFIIRDVADKALIIGLPDGNGLNFNFSYVFNTTAASCARDVGRGVVTTDPWGY